MKKLIKNIIVSVMVKDIKFLMSILADLFHAITNVVQRIVLRGRCEARHDRGDSVKTVLLAIGSHESQPCTHSDSLILELDESTSLSHLSKPHVLCGTDVEKIVFCNHKFLI